MLQPCVFKELREKRGYPEKLVTLGDHLLSRRLDLKLSQKDVAQQLGVTIFSIIGWEKNRHKPHVSQVPRIIEFLGHDPLLENMDPVNFGALLAHERIKRGLSQRAAAKLIMIDPSTLAKFESGSGTPPIEIGQRIRRLWLAMQ